VTEPTSEELRAAWESVQKRREWVRRYAQRPHVKARVYAYTQRAEYKAKHRERQAAYMKLKKEKETR